MTAKEPDLHAAYALETPEDSRSLYADWAATYDITFAQAMDFVLPAHVARLFGEHAGEGPVLDAGAGTGLVAQALKNVGDPVIDALDISAEMLNVARAKGLYRDTIVADLTQPLKVQSEIYNTVVSSGTFTHGHVGPEALDELLRVARRGALFVLSIKAEHFEERGFQDKFSKLGSLISGFSTTAVPIYGETGQIAHAEDRALMACFRKR